MWICLIQNATHYLFFHLAILSADHDITVKNMSVCCVVFSAQHIKNDTAVKCNVPSVSPGTFPLMFHV